MTEKEFPHLFRLFDFMINTRKDALLHVIAREERPKQSPCNAHDKTFREKLRSSFYLFLFLFLIVTIRSNAQQAMVSLDRDKVFLGLFVTLQ
jgi:hypothetical protein